MLDSGRGSAKDLESIQRELEPLASGQSDLEDVSWTSWSAGRPPRPGSPR